MPEPFVPRPRGSRALGTRLSHEQNHQKRHHHACFILKSEDWVQVSGVEWSTYPLMGDTAGDAVWARRNTTLNSISSEIRQQNAHFDMYTTRSKQQEGSTCKDFYLKCFKTTNSTAKFWRGKILRACFRYCSLISAVFLFKFLQIVQTHIIQKYLYKTQILRCRWEENVLYAKHLPEMF